MSDSTPRLGLPDLPDTPELYADTVSDAFARIDAFTDLYLKGQYVDTPPASPSDGDAYLTGASPTGVWSGYAYKIAACRDGGWVMLTPFNGLRGFVETTASFIVYADGTWTDWNSLSSAAESSIASAASCDLGAVGALCVAVTGTTTITSLGAAANKLRLLRFAGALTLTHNATSLILPGAANITTAAGDTAEMVSDGSGNWRCRHYQRASGQPVATALSVAAISTTGAASFGALLNVSSTIRSQGQSNPASGAGVELAWDGSVGYMISFDRTGAAYEPLNLIASRIMFSPGAGEAARFGTDGSFLLGTTTNGGWPGSAKMEVRSGGTSLSAYSTVGSAFVSRVDNAASGIFAGFYFNGATNIGSVVPTGGGTGVVYNTTSDARLKTVSAQQAEYRNAIRALWVGDFTWNDGGAPGFGVLAQQAWEVMPNHQGVTRPEAADASWQAAAEPFAHLALWGVKDIYALIEALTLRLAALETAHAAG